MKLRLLATLTLSSVLASSALFAADKHSPSPTLTPLYTFLGEADGASPNEVILDPAGNLYGTAYYGGNLVNCGPTGCGVVFKIGTSGRETLPYVFTGYDGGNPIAGVFRDRTGILYGTTSVDGANGGGSLFNLRPQPRTCATAPCPWIETVVHSFGPFGGEDGSGPWADLIQDANGNFYGTTPYGGGSGCNNNGCGTVFRLDTEGNYTVLYGFAGGPNDGQYPFGSLLLDAEGNLYGTTANGGAHSSGTVFELSRNGSGWTESILYNFTLGLDGGYPDAGLIADANGNLYGTTTYGGVGNGNGVVFELSASGSGWTETTLHAFTGPPDGATPLAKLIQDSAGNLYGTTIGGGLAADCPWEGGGGCGTIFKLTPNGSGWDESVLYSFTGGTDGALLYGPVVMDGQGNLYGAAAYGGDLNATNPACFVMNTPAGCGTVFKLTQ